jgi:hypothetical protein
VNDDASDGFIALEVVSNALPPATAVTMPR